MSVSGGPLGDNSVEYILDGLQFFDNGVFFGDDGLAFNDVRSTFGDDGVSDVLFVDDFWYEWFLFGDVGSSCDNYRVFDFHVLEGIEVYGDLEGVFDGVACSVFEYYYI